LCCQKGLTLINGHCSVPLERTEEERREVQKFKENCLEEVKDVENFRKLVFLPSCQNQKEIPLKNVRIKLGQVT
jgi:hypothetical protein